MAIAAPLSTYRTTVKKEWVDYNHHLNDGYYLVIFSLATDAFMDQIAMDAAARESTKTTIYTLEGHINYLREVKEGEEVEVRTQLIGFDQKRFQLFHTMHVARFDGPAATSEFMLLNVDTSGEDAKSAAFREDVATKLREIMQAHSALPKPDNSGRAIALPKR